MQSLGCEVITESWGRHKNNESYFEKLFGRINDIVRIRKRLSTEQFDVVIVKTAHDWSTLGRDILLLLSTRRFNGPIVLQMHGSQSDLLIQSDHHFFKWATYLLLRLSDAILVLSSIEQQEFKKFYQSGKYHVVDNPFLPLDDFSPVKKMPLPDPDINHQYSILFVGRLIESKGVFDILVSLPSVIRRINCHLIIAGDGPQKEEVQKCISSLNLQARVTLWDTWMRISYSEYIEKRISSSYQRTGKKAFPLSLQRQWMLDYQ